MNWETSDGPTDLQLINIPYRQDREMDGSKLVVKDGTYHKTSLPRLT